jgi:hypothetical protein
MPTVLDYRFIRDGAWRLVVLPGPWNRELRKKVMVLVREQSRSKHPQTVVIEAETAGCKKKFYLKVFHGSQSVGGFKDLGRASKAFRFWRQGLSLTAAGFNVPLTIAAGELRRLRLLDRAFVLTSEVDGQPVPAFLTELANVEDRKMVLRLKRAGVARLADLIRRFHSQGFVHGDLVASNLLVSQDRDGELTFFFMDNDRTRQYPLWFSQSLWKRNLIQLNRMPLPGISLQDRMRFLRAYLTRQELSRADRRFAWWLEEKTRKRRKECDGVDPTVNFRRLMRWTPGSV